MTTKRNRRSNDTRNYEKDIVDTLVTPQKTQKLQLLNEQQKRYYNKIKNNKLIFATGPAGTGKTHIAASVAAEYLLSKKVERIIVLRPVVEAGEELGFLPGTLQEKMEPYLAPLMICLSKSLSASHIENLIKNEKIIVLPLAFCRGWTFENAFVILDEAQNVTRGQMKLFLTRIGEGSTIIVDGDTAQKDLKVDGLEDAMKRLDGVEHVAYQRFTTDDVVRDGLVREVIIAYDNPYPTVVAKITDENNELDEGLNRFIGS